MPFVVNLKTGYSHVLTLTITVISKLYVFEYKVDTGGRGRTNTLEKHNFGSCALTNSATPLVSLIDHTNIKYPSYSIFYLQIIKG